MKFGLNISFFKETNFRTSTSTTSGWDASCNGVWKTIYRDANNNVLGHSISKANGWDGRYNCIWNTTYYDTNSNLLGYSTSTPGGWDATYNCGWGTVYYDIKQNKVGYSASKASDWDGKSNSSWCTTYYDAKHKELGCATSVAGGWDASYNHPWTTNNDSSNPWPKKTESVPEVHICSSSLDPQRTSVEVPKWKREMEQAKLRYEIRKDCEKTIRKHTANLFSWFAETRRLAVSNIVNCVKRKGVGPFDSTDYYDLCHKVLYTMTINFNVIEDLVRLLEDSSILVKKEAQRALLIFSKGIAGDNKDFLKRIRGNASEIIDSMKSILLDGTKTIAKNVSKIEQAVLVNSLNLFYKLPLDDSYIKSCIKKENVILFLAEMRVTYGRDSKVGEIISQLFKGMVTADNSYKNKIKEAEEQTALPSVSQLKTVYLAQVGFFNAGVSIFADDNEDTNSLIEKLKERAAQHQGGASEKTLRHFGFYKDEVKKEDPYQGVTLISPYQIDDYPRQVYV